MQEYDPQKPNDYEQMLLRKRRIEKQLTTKINIRKKQQQASVSECQDITIDLNATAEDAFNQRLQKSSQQNSKIKKMMENMGWQGKGLGK